jgi:hypothetical protein
LSKKNFFLQHTGSIPEPQGIKPEFFSGNGQRQEICRSEKKPYSKDKLEKISCCCLSKVQVADIRGFLFCIFLEFFGTYLAAGWRAIHLFTPHPV